MYSHIIDPSTNNKLDIQSYNGKKILNNYLSYVNNQKGGGNIFGPLSNQPTPMKELPCLIINLPLKNGPIINYFNSWITDDKKVILESQIIIEQILLALWGRNKPLVERSGKIIETVKDFQKQINFMLKSLQNKDADINTTVTSIKELIDKLNSILPNKKLLENKHIISLLSSLDELSNAQKALIDSKKSLALESSARKSEGLSADTEIDGSKSKVLESRVEVTKILESLKTFSDEELPKLNNLLSKISQSSNRSRTVMLRKLNFDNLRSLRVDRSNPKQLALFGSNILYSNSGNSGQARRIQIDIRVVNDYMLSAKLSSIESGKPIKLKISSTNPSLDHKINISNEELKNIDGVLLLSIPRSIILTDISRGKDTQEISSEGFMRSVEMAVSNPRNNEVINELVEKLLISKSREVNYKKFLNYILEAILTKKNRTEYYVHNIAPFFDPNQRKIVSYGDKNINKSFILEISNFTKINNGYSMNLKLHELIPKFRKGRSLEYYRGLPYSDFSKVLTEIASINLENVSGEILPNYVFTGNLSFFDICSIM